MAEEIRVPKRIKKTDKKTSCFKGRARFPLFLIKYYPENRVKDNAGVKVLINFDGAG